ncbi:phorbol esters/diacylglycerol binding domain protein [Cooperia oncophora]
MTSLRRNALNPDDECQLPDTKRHKKTSVAGRLYETSELSEIALSHRVQRTVQPSKCSHCDTLSILYTVQCTECGAQWHKTCFPKTTQTCGQSARPSDRRMSIFGVSLEGHLEMQRRNIPLIIESTIHELQKRGMRVKVS